MTDLGPGGSTSKIIFFQSSEERARKSVEGEEKRVNVETAAFPLHRRRFLRLIGKNDARPL